MQLKGISLSRWPTNEPEGNINWHWTGLEIDVKASINYGPISKYLWRVECSREVHLVVKISDHSSQVAVLAFNSWQELSDPNPRTNTHRGNVCSVKQNMLIELIHYYHHHHNHHSPPQHHIVVIINGQAREGHSRNLLETFLAFFRQTIVGCGSPRAAQKKLATPPTRTPWFVGFFVISGGSVVKQKF